MPDRASSVMLIHDGGLGALVTLGMLLEREPRPTIRLWAPAAESPLVTQGAPAWSSRVAFAQQQAAVHDLPAVIEPSAWSNGSPTNGSGPGWPEGRNLELGLELLRVLSDAASLDCRRVLWPVVAGEDIDALFAATEQARLVGRFAELDRATRSIVVDLPLADLTWRPVLDLARELDSSMADTWQRPESADVRVEH